MATTQDPGKERGRARGPYTTWTDEDDSRLLAAFDQYTLQVNGKTFDRAGRIAVWEATMVSVLEDIGKADKTVKQIERRIRTIKDSKTTSASSGTGKGGAGRRQAGAGEGAAARSARKGPAEWTQHPPHQTPVMSAADGTICTKALHSVGIKRRFTP